MDTTLTPCMVAGMIWLSTMAGSESDLKIFSRFGQSMSASRTPTAFPCFARRTAKLTATVLLPTPPLPLYTAILFFIRFR